MAAAAGDKRRGKGKKKGSGEDPSRRRKPEDPGQRTLTARQAEYFARASDLSAKELTGAKVAEVAERLRFAIDPALWFHQRVCGRVVKTDPSTGQQHGVPFATVHVEDTDCSFLGLFPVEHPYFWWLFPFSCQRETITTVTTDECGNFCVDIPRWDIDRILRLRLERHCYPEIFKPRIPDLVERIPGIRLPGDGVIDPPPIDLVVGGRFGAPQPVEPARFGEHIEQPLDAPLPRIAPPLDDAVRERAQELLSRLGKRVNDTPKLPSAERAIGPFLRCRDVLVAEWELLVDVPDITFRVTQDVDGDGTEEVIYSEGYFDVRWNATAIGPVELEASPIAKAATVCGLEPVPCGDVPALLQIGRMPAVAPYLDTDGYATRVNRPRAGGHPSGVKLGAAQSPFTGELQISGCYEVVDGAQHFRVLDTYDSVEQAITGVSWTVGATVPPFWITMTPDADGWYAIADAQKQVDPHLVMSWPVAGRGSGPHQLRLELGDGSKNSLAFSDPLPVVVDDRAPDLSLLSVRWREAGTAGWPEDSELVGANCPVVRRPVGQDVELRVVWSASAPHFRNAALQGQGCGAGSGLVHAGGSGGPAVVLGTDTVARWHTSTTETGLTRTEVFTLPKAASEGAYGIAASAFSRAFEPAGATGPSLDWHFDRSDRKRRVALRFAVINA